MKISKNNRAAVALVGLLAITAQASAEIDLTSREGVIAVNRKIQCSTIDNEETTYIWHGKAYSRKMGERDKQLFGLLGMNVRKCVTVKNDKGEAGYRLVSREIMLYLDPKTGELMDTWDNPWTGETLDVIHVANDPVNQRPSFGYGRDGKVIKLPIRKVADYWQMNVEVPLFYYNVLAGDYQKYVGGTYHATEIFDFYGVYDDLVSEKTTTVKPGVAWVRISDWLPWMEMNGREGGLYFNAQGAKLDSWNDLPKLMKDQIAKNYPEYTNAPAGDDTRPNETSWTFFKKVLDERNKNKSGPKAGH
ncbi:MAG: DUF1838 domain-containing protein [Halioglobus sp.]|nr:DUF1838 domain-containing protein [Halioglobus sp.]